MPPVPTAAATCLRFAELPLDLLACPECGGGLLRQPERLGCVKCKNEYPIALGVPLLVKGCRAYANPNPAPRDTLVGLCNAYGIPADPDALAYFERVLASNFSFADSALDGENNLLLQRVNIQTPAKRCPEDAGPASAPHWEMVRHYIPAQLDADLDTSYNVRIRNSGRGPLRSDWKNSGSGYELVAHWIGAAADEAGAPVPVSLLPGDALTVPIYFKTPPEPGNCRLQIAMRGPDGRTFDPLEVPVKVRRATPSRLEALKQRWFPAIKLEPVRGPAIEGYDEDHREAIRMVHAEAGRRGSKNGLEIGGCSTPMTVNLKCQIISTDIDVQTSQVGRYTLARRDQTNVAFVCCDSHALPFQPNAFDFVAIFSALHHFSDPALVLRTVAKLLRPDGFAAVMCEPLGHYRGQPDDECLQQMSLGVNEQRFSLDEYDRMFRDAGLEPVTAQINADSLKSIWKLRSRRFFQ